MSSLYDGLEVVGAAPRAMMPPDLYAGLTQPRAATGPLEAIQAGYQGSATGLMLRGRLPDVVLDPGHAKWYEKALASAGQLVAEFPEMVVGAIAGTAAGSAAGTAVAPGPGTFVGGLTGGGAGAFAVPAAIRTSLMQAYSKGEVKSSGDFLARTAIVLKETAKEALVGAATLGAGGAAARVVGKAIAPAIGETISVGTARAAIGTAATAAEIGTMVVAPAALDGRLPEPEDFLNAAILVGGLKGAAHTAGKLRSVYESTGIRPEQVVADAKADPAIGKEMAADGDAMPTAYKPLSAAEAAANAVPDPVKVAEVVGNLKGEITEGKQPNHINYRYVNEPEHIQAIHARVSEAFRQEIEQQRGAPKGWEASAEEARQALAASLGVKPDALQRGNLSLDAEIMAKNAMMQRAAFDVAEAARAVREAGENVTDQQVRAMHGAVETLSAVQANFLGNAAELGRALNALKAAKQTEVLAKDLAALRERFGDDPHLIAKIIGELGTVEKIAKFAKTATVWEKVVEGWKAGILSGPVTHMANLMGNTTMVAMRPLVDLTAAAIGKLSGANERVSAAEPFLRVFGNLHGAKEALMVAGSALRIAYEEGGLKGVVKEVAVGKEMEGPQKVEQFRKAIEGTKGDIIRLPFRALALADGFFKLVTERGEAYALAARQAIKEDHNIQTWEFRRRVADLVQNDAAIAIESKAAGLRFTFNTPLGEKGQAVSNLVRKAHLEMFVPFIRTPANILKELTRMTPLAPVIGEWRDAVKAGGAERAKALAEIGMGSAIMGVVASMAMDGSITGQGSPDTGKRRMAIGVVQPYSVKIGDTFYNYQRLQPVGTLMGLAADMAEVWDHMTDEEMDKVPKMISIAFANAVTNQTFLQGVTNIVNAMSDPKRFGPKLAQNMAASAVPAIVGQPTAMNDPVVREVNSMLDAIKARIPVARESLMPKRDVFGEPIKTKERLGAISPVTEMKESEDKVRTEAVRLGVSAADAPKKIHIGRGTGKLGDVEITPEQRNQFTEAAGKFTHQVLAPIVNSPNWDAMPDMVKKRIYQRTFAIGRKQAALSVFTPEQRAGLAEAIVEDVQTELERR